MRTRIFFYVFTSSILIVGIIGFAVIKRYTTPKFSISPLNSNDYNFNPVDDLKFFYEPKKNVILQVDQRFLNALGYKPGIKVAYSINKDGLNNLTNYSVEKPSGVFRIITLGDSFTFGQNVSTKDNYPSQLEYILNKSCSKNKYEVINLGVGGYGIRYAIERYKIRGKKYNPDLILWLLIPGDFARIEERLIPEFNKIINKKTTKYDAGNNLIDSLAHKDWKRAIESANQKLGGEQIVLDIQKENLNLLNNYYDKSLVIFSLSNLVEKYNNILSLFSDSRKDIHIYNDAPNIYSNHNYFLNDGHPTPEGYKVIVDDIFKYLKKNKLISCGN